jgi:NAD(P)-dependent dehydrogenase (short-subunit alcohol dehydrogenase family)
MRVLITGASGGLGPAVVEEFHSQGHTVIGVARSWPQADPRMVAVSADLTQSGECARVVSEAGEIDALVHVMGGYAGGSPVSETDEGTWDRMMDLNLRSAFLIMRAVLPGMLERKRGTIIAVGSRVAVEPVPTLAAYGVSKAGLVHLIRTLALELKHTGLTANVVMPSTIDTQANRRAMPKADPSQWVRPESIARVVSWLASDAARDVSGAVVPVYGQA